MLMQIYIVNKKELDDIIDFSEQRKVHQSLFNAVIRALSEKKEINSFLIKRDHSSDYVFNFSHAFSDLLFFEFKGVVS